MGSTRLAVRFIVAFVFSLAVAVRAAASQPTPALSLEAFFAGSSYSAGQTTTLFSRPQPFTARFSGVLDRNELMLDERFSFPKGERLQRWELRQTGPSSYSGTVQTETIDGVLREPRNVTGRVSGSRVVLSYVGYAPGQSAVLFHFRHTMQMQDDGTVTNRVTVWKLGVPLAWADVTFAKTAAELLGREHRSSVPQP